MLDISKAIPNSKNLQILVFIPNSHIWELHYKHAGFEDFLIISIISMKFTLSDDEHIIKHI